MKISKYPSATSIAEADTFVMVQSGETKKVTVAVLKQLLDIGDVFQYKGVIDCSLNPNYPAADAGWAWKISVAGRIGGVNGKVVEVGDTVFCNHDATPSGDETAVGTNWDVVQANWDIDYPVLPEPTVQSDFIVAELGTSSGLEPNLVNDDCTSLDGWSGGEDIWDVNDGHIHIVGDDDAEDVFRNPTVKFTGAGTAEFKTVFDSLNGYFTVKLACGSERMVDVIFINSEPLVGVYVYVSMTPTKIADITLTETTWRVQFDPTNNTLELFKDGVSLSSTANVGRSNNDPTGIAAGTGADVHLLSFKMGDGLGAFSGVGDPIWSKKTLAETKTILGIETPITNHNNLSTIQGGSASPEEYYHLDSADYTALTAATAQLPELQTDGNPEFEFLLKRIKTIYKTQSSEALVTAECKGTIVSNYGMTDADCAIPLPAASEGLSFICVLPAVRAKYFHLVAAGGEYIYLSGVKGSAAGFVGVASGYAEGTACQMFTFKNAAGAWSWFCLPIFGTWVAG